MRTMILVFVVIDAYMWFPSFGTNYSRMDQVKFLEDNF